MAIVTGAGRGIGAAIASALSDQGYRLALCSRSERATELAAALDQSGAEAFGVVTDVSDPEALRTLAGQTIERFGRIDALVNNAAVNYSGNVAEMAQEPFDELYAVNVRGVFFGVQAVLPAMVEQGGGAIVNVASFTGRTPVAGFSAYSATKAAVLSLTRAHALELAEHDITVNAVCPGNVWSDIWEVATRDLNPESSKTPRDHFDDAIAATPLKRPQTGSDIGEAVSFLCGPGARNITGEAIYVTGGL